MKTNTHLHFNGHCLEAFKFYEKIVGGKISFVMTWGDSPASKEVSKEWQKKIIHARLEWADNSITADDAPPERYERPQGFDVILHFKTNETAKAEAIFDRLSENGKVRMPFEKTFFSPGFGMVTDQFGTPWMIYCDQK